MITSGSPPLARMVATFRRSGPVSMTPGRGLIAPSSASIRTSGGRSGATADRLPVFQSSPARFDSAAPSTWLVTPTVGPARTLGTGGDAAVVEEGAAEFEQAAMAMLHVATMITRPRRAIRGVEWKRTVTARGYRHPPSRPDASPVERLWPATTRRDRVTVVAEFMVSAVDAATVHSDLGLPS